MMQRISYNETAKFQKDFKKLQKKFKTLKEDFELAKKATIELYHIQGIDNLSIFRIPGFKSEEIHMYKIKKFACKALKGRGAKNGQRVIYALHVSECRVDFIEIYFKGKKENEDQTRIKEYLNTC